MQHVVVIDTPMRRETSRSRGGSAAVRPASLRAPDAGRRVPGVAMTLYEIRYTDEFDTGCQVFEQRLRAYSAAHAEERFWDDDCFDDGCAGWKILSVKPARAGGRDA